MVAVWLQQAMTTADQRFADAHRALTADSSIQFAYSPMPPPKPPPAWLRELDRWLTHAFRPIGRFINWVSSFMPAAPWARIILWTMLVLAAAGLIWLLVERIRGGEWRWPRWRRRRAAETAAMEEEWSPDAAPARAWLQEADALAAQGDYAEAVHHLLRRSIEDIERRRPQLVRPALTSRDLAAAEAIPLRARGIFADIAGIVERSLFGGRAVTADDWGEAREAYADFALARAWAA